MNTDTTRPDVSARELADILRVHPDTLRKWIKRNAPASLRTKPRTTGGSELMVGEAGQEAARGHFGRTRPDAPGRETDMPARTRPDVSAGWEAFVAELRRERDEAQAKAQEALQRAMQAEHALSATQERVERQRGAWSTWYMLACRWRSRLFGLPLPPVEFADVPLLAPPKG